MAATTTQTIRLIDCPACKKRVIASLTHIGPSKCLFILGPGGYFPGQQFPLDTPCEVLG